jgi:C4-dicarboxylate transporter, DctM subunit
MGSVEIALLSVVLMLLLIYSGMHVSIALIFVSFAGVSAMRDVNTAGNLLSVAFTDVIADYSFGVIPLFVLMGLVADATGVGRDAFAVANQLLRRLAGGLGVATVAANAIFAAITGISIASAAVFSKIAVPEMLRHGYSTRFAVGVVAGSSILGMLIPPSLLFIIYGLITEQSVGSLFIAGIIPGLLLAVIFAFAILIAGYWWPTLMGDSISKLPGPHDPALSVFTMLAMLAPIAILVFLVLGGIYAGIFTPTEAGAVGAAGALVDGIIRRRLDLRSFWRVLVETGQITAAVSVLIIGAGVYSRMLAISGMPTWLTQFAADSSFDISVTIVAFIVVILILGSILDSASIMLLTLPVVLPIFVAANVDLIWLGVVTILAVEIGLLTPPFGMSAYVIKATLGLANPISLYDIFVGAAPFAALTFLVLVLVFMFPVLATALL